MRKFAAAAAAAEERRDVDAFVVVLAEHLDGTGRRLEIQRPLVVDEQDRELGHDSYSISTETGATCYGGVESWVIADRTLVLRLRANASDTLDADGGFVVELEPEHESMLKDGLARAFGATR